jgi:protein tyrosine/serine phosphatase
MVPAATCNPTLQANPPIGPIPSLLSKKISKNKVGKQMEQISNFRDAAIGNMKPNLIFRSATLDKATKSDIEKIVSKLNIQTIIDLRGKAEHKTVLEEPTLIREYYSNSHYPTSEAQAPTITSRRLFKLDLAKSIAVTIKRNMSFLTMIIFVFLKCIGFKLYARQMVIRNSIMGEHGLYGLNMGILINGTELREFFDLIRDEKAYPIIIHCSAGKDRTGLAIALLQSLSGASKEPIFENYAKSYGLLEKERERIRREIAKTGMGREFERSDPETLKKTFEFIEEKYGSLKEYLMSIGVDEKQQSEIKSIMNQ